MRHTKIEGFFHLSVIGLMQNKNICAIYEYIYALVSYWHCKRLHVLVPRIRAVMINQTN